MTADAPSIHSIQIGRPRTFDGPEPWVSAIVKTVVEGPVELTEFGLQGDRQADQVNHGGRDKAVCSYAFDHYRFWIDRLGLEALQPGAFGENVTVAGLADAAVCIGDVITVGNAVVQISQPRQPCWKLARQWGMANFAEQVVEANRTGWYFRVLHAGVIRAGDPLVVIDRPHPEWTIEAANEVMHRGARDPEASAVLAAVPALSHSWASTLRRRSGG